jgi:hypothetical protein
MGHLIGIMLSPSGGPAVHTGAPREHPHVLDGLRLDKRTKQELESVGSLPCDRAAHAVQEGMECRECFNAL